MPRAKSRKNKVLPRLPGETDLHEIFGQAATRQTFADQIDSRLADTDLQRVLAEKRGKKPRPPTLKERLRTYPPPQEELDLHGTIGAEAEARVVGFLNASTAFKHRTVRIITGKGKHTEGPAVLPPLVEATLAQLKQAGRILHYAWDQKTRERSGAVLVYLK